MNTTIKVKGMSCNHCVSSVEKAVSAIPSVSRVDVNLKAGTAQIETAEPIADEILRAAIESAGYEHGGAA